MVPVSPKPERYNAFNDCIAKRHDGIEPIVELIKYAPKWEPLGNRIGQDRQLLAVFMPSSAMYFKEFDKQISEGTGLEMQLTDAINNFRLVKEKKPNGMLPVIWLFETSKATRFSK